MVSLIRDELDAGSEHTSPRQSGAMTFVLVLIVLLGLTSMGVALYFAAVLGWNALILLAGVAFCGLLICVSRLSRSETAPAVTLDQTQFADAYYGAFVKALEPTILLREGKPWRMNEAYTQLARKMGAMGISDMPPSVDRLFGGGDRETASAIFRLHHMRDGVSSVQENIDAIDVNGNLLTFDIKVTRLGDAQMWQITDISAQSGREKGVLTSAPVGLFSVNLEGQVLATNSVLDRWLGMEPDVKPELMHEFIQDVDVLLDIEPTVGRVVRADTRLITRKGVVSPIVLSAVWNELDNGEPYASVALYGHSSIGAPVMAQARQTDTVLSPDVLQASSIHESFDASPVAILELLGDEVKTAKIKRANPVFENMSEGLYWRDTEFSNVLDPKSFSTDALAQSMATGEPFDAVLAGKEELPVSVYIASDAKNASRHWAYLVDISPRKALEDQLLQSQKMQAIGQLAAGVAHDFNNLLTTIRLNTDELLGRHPVGDPSYRELQDINTTVNRASALVKKLLAFSRKQTLRLELLNVTDTLSDLSVNLKQSLGERIKLNVFHGRGLPPIRADKSQLDTVLLNLCVNARDAMEDQGGGEITIRTSAVKRKELELDGIVNIIGDDFVRVAFTDNGVGMPEEVKVKIFEPFFTTKEQGKGTGLGLATVYGIIQQSGGYLGVQSTLGVGTTFNIYLRVAEAADEEEIVALNTPKPAVKPVDLTGQGTILFVEDEISVRTIAAKTLRKRGYKVIEAGDGEEAFEILEDGDTHFDLMISDVVMPSMDGPTLLKKGRHLLGDARIVFISGYAEEEFSDLLSEEPDVTFLPKPFTLAQLAEKVKAEIGESVQ